MKKIIKYKKIYIISFLPQSNVFNMMLYLYYICKFPSDLEIKIGHEDTHATVLDINISLVDDIFVYKQYNKRDKYKRITLLECIK